MDPVSLAVTLLAIYGMLTRTPGLVGEAAREIGYARRGEESPAAKARRQRLTAAGIDPAAGGPFRQYAGNVWRDYWLDKDAARKDARVQRDAQAAADQARSWWDRWADRVDEEVSSRADRWRTRTPDDQQPPVAKANDNSRPPAGGTPNPATPDVDPGSGPGGAPQPSPVSDPDPAMPWEPGPGVVHDDDVTAPPTGGPEPVRPPIRVAATVGDPIGRPTAPTAPTAEPAAITAGGTMTIAAQAVTGVVSGAAEARAIQRQTDAAAQAFVAELARIRARINSLGEQTVGTVQQSTHSQVVRALVAAAESAAAAQAAANRCVAEVAPLMGQVARKFNALNS